VIYINGRGVNPLVTIVALVLLALMGFLLLPILGGLFLVFLFFVAGLFLYGLYWRWRHGDPLKQMQEELAKKMAEQSENYGAQSQKDEAPNTMARTKVGVKRSAEVEDAVIVDEIERRP